MSEENVEIVRQVYEALNRRDWDAMFRDTHPDFVLTTQRGPLAGTERGREQVTKLAEEWIAGFDKIVWEPERVFEAENQVVVFVEVCSRPKGGTVDMVVRNGHLWTIRDGAIVSMKTFPARQEALEAAGLSE